MEEDRCTIMQCIMAQTDKFFMVLTLIGLRPNLESVQNQILASPSVPSLDDVFARLLHLSSTQTLLTDGPSDSSVLAFQANSRGGRSGNRGRGQRPQCTYCNKLGHTRNRCYQLHARPPHSAHIAQSSDPLLSRPDFAASSTSQSITLIGSDYDAIFDIRQQHQLLLPRPIMSLSALLSLLLLARGF